MDSSILYDLVSDRFWSIIIVFLVLYLINAALRNARLPKGPYGLPVVGYIPFIDRSRMSEQFAALSKRYNTDILCISAWGSPMVVLNTYALLKEAFQKRLDLQDRPPTTLFRSIEEDYAGVITTSGTAWKETRRFSLTMLRDFGMGRVGAEEMIQTESEALVKHFHEHDGEAFDPKEYINISVSNIICGMVFGKTFQHDNQDFRNALKGMNDMFTRFSSWIISFSVRWKIGRKLLFKNKWQQVVEDYNKMRTFVDKQIEEHKDNYTGEVTDLIYGYIREMKEGKNPVFDESMLRSLIIDFFIAGSETTYSTLRWGILSMATWPQIQKNVQDELDEKIGDRLPSMNDKKSTPYTEAVLSEVQRHFTLVPLGLAHTNQEEDIELGGSTIPRNTVVLANLHQIHHDDKFWKNPAEFDPQNFLEDGKVVNLDRLVPFSIGRRACAGESLAKMELYIFFTFIVKNFNIKLETDDTVPDLVGTAHALRLPKPFKVRMTARR